MIDIALLGRWHVHAEDYAREARAHPELRIVAVWDDDAARGRGWAEELGVAFEPDLDALLARPGLAGVVVTTATADHPEVIGRALVAGRHVFTEKVLAARTADAAALLDAAAAAGRHLVLSLPRLSEGPYLAARAALDAGRLGRVTLARCRVAHEGALAGWLPERFYDPAAARGGALIDLGAHPIYLLNRLMGPPEALTAHLAHATGRAVDDNAVVACEYEGGALGLMETGFASRGGAAVLELHGTEGTLLAEDGRVRWRRERTDAWEELAPPAPLPSPLAQWVDAIARGVAPRQGRADALDLTRVNEAAARAAAQGRRVALSELGGA